MYKYYIFPGGSRQNVNLFTYSSMCQPRPIARSQASRSLGTSCSKVGTLL